VLLTCPVHGPHTYTDDFGAPRPGHIHAGVDIPAPTGTPIVAPFPGHVVQSWDPGGGNDVYVYGSWGYVVNMHLSRFGATGNVNTGTVIGYVGSTGDATGPHDHFEMHPKTLPAHLWRSPYGYTTVGTAIDGYPYLNSVC
jgi:murein DD-endopeptidase MepM/ murein hydrolase activator NlpD